VPAVAIGIGAACLLKQVRAPWYSLACFATFGATTMLLFKSLGVFASQSQPPRVAFDGGQFVINCLLASPLFLVSAFWIKRLRHCSLYVLCLCIGLGALLFPSMILLGNASTSSDLSMKNYTVFATALGAATVSASSVLIGKQIDSSFQVRLCIGFGLVVMCLGFANSFAYAMSSMLMRFPNAAPPISKLRHTTETALPLDYFKALRYVREASGRSVVIAVKPFPLVRDPAVIISGRRSFLPNDFFVEHALDESLRDDLKDRLKRWSQWEQSSFADEDLAKWFSDRTDILVIEGESPSRHWRPIEQFNDWGIYKSVSR
jgi:hypothetical protein